uniref:DDRGK domain-containing protein 1 n=1 Tax=Biomphalaria glabrata TaxID=6526 RepID=A0A2C9KR77_BIOGL
REKRELEEYLALKESFAVEEEGFDQLEEEESHNLMREFAEYIKKSKVVNMDELAAHFGLKSDEAISRLQYFLENGILEGVMDDRGKFICITDEELNAVAKFINQRGRVTIQELAEYSNRLICLEGSA